MSLQVHHVFVCSDLGAPEAKALIDAGLIEGSGNVHAGQGTANRRFFFQRGFLELLWVYEVAEAMSDQSAPTQLWERWSRRKLDANRFGLCFASEQRVQASALPFPTRSYQPEYLSADRSILFADKLSLQEPEIFLLDWPQARTRSSEPREHQLGLLELKSVSIGLPRNVISPTLPRIAEAGLFSVHESEQAELVLDFLATSVFALSFPSLGIKIVSSVA
jgi:hypothetical protein